MEINQRLWFKKGERVMYSLSNYNYCSYEDVEIGCNKGL